MQIDFSTVDDVQDFISVPEGAYACRIVEVRESITREGHPRWAFRLEVAGGEYIGRTAAWDSLIWSPRALPRAKTVLMKLGFDVSGALSIESNDLIGREVRADLIAEEHENPETGRRTTRLRVPYLGYEALSGSEHGAAQNGEADDTEPF